MSKWQYGCGKRIEVGYTRGWEYRTMKVECGSTGPDGDVAQCENCERLYPTLSVWDDESDGEWQARMSDYYDDY